MEIVISGFAPETTEADLREAMETYGAHVLSINILISNNPDRYVAMIDVETDELGCKVLVEKVNGLVWNGHRLRAGYFLQHHI